MAERSSVLLRKVCGKQRPTANHSARSCQSMCMLACWRQLELEKLIHVNRRPCIFQQFLCNFITTNGHVPGNLVLMFLLKFRNCWWQWLKWVTVSLVLSEWFSWCCLLLEPEEDQWKTISKTAGDFSTNLQNLKTCLQFSASFSFFLILRSKKLLFTPGFRVVNHPLSNNQPPIGQRLGTFGGPIVTSNASTQFRTKFTPLPWPMSYNLCIFLVWKMRHDMKSCM